MFVIKGPSAWATTIQQLYFENIIIYGRPVFEHVIYAMLQTLKSSSMLRTLHVGLSDQENYAGWLQKLVRE